MTDTTPQTFLARAEALLIEAREHSWARDAFPDHDPTDQPSHRSDDLGAWNRAHEEWKRVDDLQRWALERAAAAVAWLRTGFETVDVDAMTGARDALRIEKEEVVGREEAETFGRFALAVELATLDRTAIIARVHEAVSRVFGWTDLIEPVAHKPEPWAPVRVQVRGWPETVAYDPFLALAVLYEYDDGAGSTQDGDAAVCRDLEEEGAVLDVGASR